MRAGYARSGQQRKHGSRYEALTELLLAHCLAVRAGGGHCAGAAARPGEKLPRWHSKNTLILGDLKQNVFFCGPQALQWNKFRNSLLWLLC